MRPPGESLIATGRGLANTIGLLLATLLVLLFLSPTAVQAQDSGDADGRKSDLSDISTKFARNIRFLAPMLPNPEVQKMMEVVAGKSSDLANFYRSNGGGNKRRKLLDEQEALKTKPNITRSDQKRLEDLDSEIKKLDPDNLFQKGRKDIGESIRELQGQLSSLYSGDQDVKDVIRITQQHLTYYSAALAKYQ